MKARLIAALLAVTAGLAAGCTGSAAGGPGTSGTAAGGSSVSGAGTASADHVSCGDSPGDAGLIQRTIDASAAGAVIEISGTCSLTHGITLLSGRTYTGDNRTGTVLQQAADMRYVLASSAFVHNDTTTGGPLTIEQLTVACSGHGQTDGIIILNYQADVQNVDVMDCGGSGIVDTSQTANGASINNTSVNSRFTGNFITGSGADGFQVIDNRNAVTDGYLVNNQIASSAGDAINLANAAGWNISGNHLYSVGGNAIMAQRLFGTVISGNYIEDFASTKTTGTWYGISGTAQDGNGSTITGNSISNDAGERGQAQHIYIAITSTSAGTGHITVTGNVIVGASQGDVGLSFNGSNHSLNVVSSGNVVSAVGTVIQHSGAVHLSAGA